MSLTDLLRQNTKELRDTLAEIERVRSRYVTDRTAAEERLKRASTDISTHHKDYDEKKELLSSIENKIREINRQIDEIDITRQALLSTLQENQQKVQDFKRSLSTAEQDANKAQRAVREEKKRIEEAERHINDIDKQRARYQNSLFDQNKTTLLQYLSESSRLIEQQLQEHSVRAESLQALDNLKRKRHEVRDVGDLCDARDEWKRLLKTASVPAVKAAAESEIHRIEQKINELFPGALKAESIAKPEYIEELYYYTDSGDRTVLLIPIAAEVWKSLSDGKQTQREATALYLFASIGHALGQPPTELEYEYDDIFVSLVCKAGKSVLQEKNDITVNLPGGGSVSFILSALPIEIQEALLS